ncbi:MAG: PVC-type heme-binding CxxCH protein [Niabella sp.]
MKKQKNIILIGLLVLITGFTACKQNRYPDSLSPEDALKTLQIADGYTIELFANEPFVYDPVTMEFDENGNCYVALMPDAPFTPKPGEERGQIRVLLDINNDGVIDSSIVFADKLSEATSLLPWKGGLLVTAAPDILFLKDTNNDFKADIREKLFTGFFKNNYETQISNLQFSVDNWIYANNRGQAGDITNTLQPSGNSLDVKGGDFRFRLDKNSFENETGPGQFGQDIDSYGNRFITENSIPIQQMLIAWRYTHRHPYLPTTKAIKNISDHDDIMYQVSETPYWRAERTKKRNKEFQERKLKRVEYERGHFTGTSGGTFYIGDQMPQLIGNFFTGEVSGNLVHRDILEAPRDSSYFIAKRAATEKSSEFIFSKDTWFRPVNFTTGPDGYFYMLDFYRQHIETPVSIPEELQKDMNFKNGSDKGRIYRIMPANTTYKPIKPNLGSKSSKELVALLSSNNEWYAITAHRLLVERQDKSVIPVIHNIFNQGSNNKAQLHALYILEALDALNSQTIKKALHSKSSWLRYNGAILAEQYSDCYKDLATLTIDTVAKVALQATLSIGEFKNKNNTPVFIEVLSKYGYDKSFQMAILSTHEGSSPGFLTAVLNSPVGQDTQFITEDFIQNLAYVIGARYHKNQIKELLKLCTHSNLQKNKRELSLLKGLTKGIQNSPNAENEVKEKMKELSKLSATDLKTTLLNTLK